MSDVTSKTAPIIDEIPDKEEMFGPLLFENGDPSISEAPCLLCNDTFNLSICLEIFIKHLFEVHNLVVEDIQNIRNLNKYVNYWRDKFKSHSIQELVPSVKIENSDRVYLLLSDLMPEDKKLRQKLHLEFALKIQEFERSDGGYHRMCLFCKLNFEGTRTDFVHHLEDQHNLQLGNPQNLVFIEDLVAKIDTTMNDLICIYCEKKFPDRGILKEHMRKKLHKRLNHRNSDYDRFFIINYLEKKEKRKDSIEPVDDFSNNDEEYSDWNENDDLINCLFCEKKETDINALCLHMEADHDFDFVELTKHFDFYQKIKFINFVRRQSHQKRCFYCNEKQSSLSNHLYEAQHCKIPEMKLFDQPEFYFPTYENDAFLYLIDDVED